MRPAASSPSRFSPSSAPPDLNSKLSTTHVRPLSPSQLIDSLVQELSRSPPNPTAADQHFYTLLATIYTRPTLRAKVGKNTATATATATSAAVSATALRCLQSLINHLYLKGHTGYLLGYMRKLRRYHGMQPSTAAQEEEREDDEEDEETGDHHPGRLRSSTASASSSTAFHSHLHHRRRSALSIEPSPPASVLPLPPLRLTRRLYDQVFKSCQDRGALGHDLSDAFEEMPRTLAGSSESSIDKQAASGDGLYEYTMRDYLQVMNIYADVGDVATCTAYFNPMLEAAMKYEKEAAANKVRMEATKGDHELRGRTNKEEKPPSPSDFSHPADMEHLSSATSPVTASDPSPSPSSSAPFALNCVPFSILIKACSNAGQLSPVRSLYSSLISLSLRPDARLFDALLDCYGYNGESVDGGDGGAKAVSREGARKGAGREGNAGGLHASLLWVYAEMERWGVGLQAQLLSTVVEAYARNGRFVQAGMVLAYVSMTGRQHQRTQSHLTSSPPAASTRSWQQEYDTLAQQPFMTQLEEHHRLPPSLQRLIDMGRASNSNATHHLPNSSPPSPSPASSPSSLPSHDRVPITWKCVSSFITFLRLHGKLGVVLFGEPSAAAAPASLQVMDDTESVSSRLLSLYRHHRNSSVELSMNELDVLRKAVIEWFPLLVRYRHVPLVGVESRRFQLSPR